MDIPEHSPRSAHDSAHPWIVRLTRLGFIARGVLYSLIGVLTLFSIYHDHRRPQGGITETFVSISSVSIYYLRPGTVLLAGLAVGFAGFAIGMAWVAAFDWHERGRSFMGLMQRSSTFFGGIGHFGLMATALLMMIGRPPDDRDAQRWSGLALTYPGGRVLIAVVGAWAGGYGLYLMTKMITGRLGEDIDYDSMSKSAATWTSRIGRVGEFARGAIYLTIGVVLFVAGWTGTAKNVVGFGGAMHTLARDTLGWIALAAVALGLLAYGALMFIEARYYHMRGNG